MALKLWILEPEEGLPKVPDIEFVPDKGESFRVQTDVNLSINPWDPWYDKCFKAVVIASSEKEARELMAEEAAAEGKDAWLNEELSSCKELKVTGRPRVVIVDVAEA